jgi:hypothetical protein
MNSDFLTQELEVTNNNLLDIINWLKLGAYVIIHTNYARFFHKCSNLSESEVDDYIKQHRFIYVNVSKLPGLLDDGEWNWYITNAGFDECKCSIKDKVSNFNLKLPHCTKLSLGI